MGRGVGWVGAAEKRSIVQLKKKNLLMHASRQRCMCKLCAAVIPPSAVLLPSHSQEIRHSAAAATAVASELVSVLLSLCFLLSTPPCLSHVSPQPRLREGTFKAHGPPICLPAAPQGRDRWGHWPLIGYGACTGTRLALTRRHARGRRRGRWFEKPTTRDP